MSQKYSWGKGLSMIGYGGELKDYSRFALLVGPKEYLYSQQIWKIICYLNCKKGIPYLSNTVVSFCKGRQNFRAMAIELTKKKISKWNFEIEEISVS